MEDLLPYYERELAFLRHYSRDFSRRYPKIAGRLLMAGDNSEDPHVERLIEAFALLSARISKKLEDDYPEFTESLLDVLYPHYLRPFPACSIAYFDIGAAAAKLTAPVTIPRGTELLSRPVRGVRCRFRSAYDVTLSPLAVTHARFLSVAQAPAGVRLPAKACAQISLSFALGGQLPNISSLELDKVRLFVDGESSLSAMLRDVLMLNTDRVFVEDAAGGRWQQLPENPLSCVGMSDDEALIETPKRSHPAYRLLTEYFAFPDKFGFFDLDLAPIAARAGREFTLHFIVKDITSDSMTARLMDGVSATNFKLGCTPVVNLFQQASEPIHVSHTQSQYPVLADARRAWAHEVHSIDQVACVRKTEQGESVTEYRPFYSLRHGEMAGKTEHYWVASRNESVAQHNPGYEMQLSMVDAHLDTITPASDVLSCDLTCSNRDLPANLAYGIQGGDLVMEGGSVARSIALLRKPSHSYRFEKGRGSQWRLISHLSLNHVSLVEGGASSLREMLRLYDLPHSAISAAQIDGIVGLEHEAATLWLTGKPLASLARGTDIRLLIDVSHFVGSGIHAFSQVMDRFFALYVQANSFTRLTLVSHQSGKELIKCPARSGESILV